MKWLLLPLLTSTLLYAKAPIDPPETAWNDPWGKDASMNKPAKTKRPTNCCSPAQQAGIQAIRWFQRNISPIDGPRSHFRPTSSQYTLQAMQKYGFLRGYLMGCSRLTRENSDLWVYRTVLREGETYKEDPP